MTCASSVEVSQARRIIDTFHERSACDRRILAVDAKVAKISDCKADGKPQR